MDTEYPVINPSVLDKYLCSHVFIDEYIDYKQLSLQPPASYFSMHYQIPFKNNDINYPDTDMVYKYHQCVMLNASDFHLNENEGYNYLYAVRFRNTRISLTYNQDIACRLLQDVHTSSYTWNKAQILANMQPIDNAQLSIVATPYDIFDVSTFRDLTCNCAAQLIYSQAVDLKTVTNLTIPQFVLYPKWKLFAFIEYYVKGNYVQNLTDTFNHSEKAEYQFDLYIDTNAEIIQHNEAKFNE